MSLSAALNAARSSLIATSSQTSVTSRNVAGVNDPNYARKTANLATFQGAVGVVSIGRAADKALFDTMVHTTSTNAAQQAVVAGYDKLQLTIGDTDGNQSPAALLGRLTNSLQQYASTPNSTSWRRPS